MSAHAQVQQAWAARYNNGIPNGNHQALKLALDSSNNIYVCGFSQNASGGVGYAILKYAATGNLRWAGRLDLTSAPQATPTSFVIDISNNVTVTGNAGTAQWDPNGNRLWSNTYAGLSTASDANANIFITGFGTNFNTIKLRPEGTQIWSATYKDAGPGTGDYVVADSLGNAYVAGVDVNFVERNYTSSSLLVTKFGSSGNLLWWNYSGGAGDVTQVTGEKLDSFENVLVLSDDYFGSYIVDKIDSGGTGIWQLTNLTGTEDSVSHALAVSKNGMACITGSLRDGSNSEYGAYGVTSNGACFWTNTYASQSGRASAAEAVSASSSGGFFITGYSPDINGANDIINDIVTIAYDTNGKQLWLQRYTGPGYGAVGNAIAADNSGNIYVAGYEIDRAGTEMVLIKYSPITLQHQSNGAFLFQAQGSPNEPFDIQATTNLQSWLNLATNNANTNGLLQYLDTNASLYFWRFYLAIPQ